MLYGGGERSRARLCCSGGTKGGKGNHEKGSGCDMREQPEHLSNRGSVLGRRINLGKGSRCIYKITGIRKNRRESGKSLVARGWGGLIAWKIKRNHAGVSKKKGPVS